MPEPVGPGRIEPFTVHQRGDGEGAVADRPPSQLRKVPLDEPRVEPSFHHLRQGEQGAEEGDVGDDTQQVRARERTIQGGERGLAGRGVGDDLGEHRVVGGGDLEALGERVVHPRPAGQGEVEDPPAGGEEAGVRVLGVDPGLDRMAADLHILLREVELLPRGDAELRGDEVDAGDGLGDGVLDLEAGVHLEEERLVGGVRVDDELDGAGAHVVHRPRRLDRDLPELLALGGGEGGARRLLDHLLVAALEGALALPQVDDMAMGVGEDLHLEVAGRGDPALEEEGVVAEGPGGLAPRGLERGGQLGEVLHAVHALPASAGGGLDQQRDPDLGGAGEQRRVVQPGRGQARHDGHAAGGDGLAGGDLVAHGRDRGGGRADEGDARRGAGDRELGALGEEAVAGVDRVGPAGAGGAEHLVDGEIGVDAHGGVGRGDVW